MLASALGGLALVGCESRVEEPTSSPLSPADSAPKRGRCMMKTPDKPARTLKSPGPDPNCPVDPGPVPKLKLGVVRFPEATPVSFAPSAPASSASASPVAPPTTSATALPSVSALTSASAAPRPSASPHASAAPRASVSAMAAPSFLPSAAPSFAPAAPSFAPAAPSFAASAAPFAPSATASAAPAGRPPEVTVEIAEKYEDRMRGLMYRKSMGDDVGMLFVFDNDTVLKFWMKNTCIPLDMVFIAADNVIVGIEENVPTLNEDTYTANCDARYVLETNAGWTRKHGVKAGQKIEWSSVGLPEP